MTASDQDSPLDGPAFVDFRDVWLAYNDELLAQGKFAVEAIDLKVTAGEFIAIVGPSGCGKSTFMKLATGLKPPSRGEIRMAGKTVHGPLKISGMAFQSASLLPWRTTLENVLLPLEIVEPYRSELKTRRQEFESRARALLGRVGLGGYEDKFPWRLSGGMQQRASICRASSTSRNCCCWTSLWRARRLHARRAVVHVRDLQAERGFNVILVTHDLRESAFLADTIYVMSKSPGRFVVRREVDCRAAGPRHHLHARLRRDRARASRPHRRAEKAGHGDRAMKARWLMQTQAHWILLVAIVAFWQSDHLRALRGVGVHLPQSLAHCGLVLGSSPQHPRPRLAPSGSRCWALPSPSSSACCWVA